MSGDLPDEVEAALHLPDAVAGDGEPVDVSSGDVLVTGATGYFGAALVSDLLNDERSTSRTIYCIVRGGDTGPADRLRSALTDFDLWDEGSKDRLRVVEGDLSQPAGGLSDEDRQELADKVSLVYHSAAHVNLTYPFEQVRDTNVGGTVAMLELACQGRPKRFSQISTVSAVDIESRSGDELEDPAPLGSFEQMRTGYAQSKWVAEKLVAEAGERGLDTRTLRLGALAGHSRTGVSNPNDYAWLVVCACLHVGAVPLFRVPTSWLPVDLSSLATIALTEHGADRNDIFQVLPPRQVTYAHVFSWIRRYGYRLPTLSFEAWRSLLLERAEGGNKAIASIAAVLPKEGLPGGGQTHLHSPRTEKVLTDLDAQLPQLTEEIFHRYLDVATARGEVPEPASVGA